MKWSVFMFCLKVYLVRDKDVCFLHIVAVFAICRISLIHLQRDGKKSVK